MGEFSIIKFFILLIPLTIFFWIFAPTFKWKLLFTFAGAFAVWLAVSGHTVGRKH